MSICTVRKDIIENKQCLNLETAGIQNFQDSRFSKKHSYMDLIEWE